jgi:glucose dehydrogenase
VSERPAPLARNTFDPAKDFYNLTPEHAAYCNEIWEKNQMYTKGPYTPPDVEGTMVTVPSTLGGGNWNGLSYDPTLGLVFTSVMNIGQVAHMVEGHARGGGPTTSRVPCRPSESSSPST